MCLTKGDEIAVYNTPISNLQSPCPPYRTGKFQTSNHDAAWSKIASIEYTGREHVYDIEVEGTHNFVAGHFVEVEGRSSQVEGIEVEGGSSQVEGKDLPSTFHLRPSTLLSSTLDPRPSTFFFGGIIAHNTYTNAGSGGATFLQYGIYDVTQTVLDRISESLENGKWKMENGIEESQPRELTLSSGIVLRSIDHPSYANLSANDKATVMTSVTVHGIEHVAESGAVEELKTALRRMQSSELGAWSLRPKGVPRSPELVEGSEVEGELGGVTYTSRIEALMGLLRPFGTRNDEAYKVFILREGLAQLAELEFLEDIHDGTYDDTYTEAQHEKLQNLYTIFDMTEQSDTITHDDGTSKTITTHISNIPEVKTLFNKLWAVTMDNDLLIKSGVLPAIASSEILTDYLADSAFANIMFGMDEKERELCVNPVFGLYYLADKIEKSGTGNVSVFSLYDKLPAELKKHYKRPCLQKEKALTVLVGLINKYNELGKDAFLARYGSTIGDILLAKDLGLDINLGHLHAITGSGEVLRELFSLEGRGDIAEFTDSSKWHPKVFLIHKKDLKIILRNLALGLAEVSLPDVRIAPEDSIIEALNFRRLCRELPSDVLFEWIDYYLTDSEMNAFHTKVSGAFEEEEKILTALETINDLSALSNDEKSLCQEQAGKLLYSFDPSHIERAEYLLNAWFAAQLSKIAEIDSSADIDSIIEDYDIYYWSKKFAKPMSYSFEDYILKQKLMAKTRVKYGPSSLDADFIKSNGFGLYNVLSAADDIIEKSELIEALTAAFEALGHTPLQAAENINYVNAILGGDVTPDDIAISLGWTIDNAKAVLARVKEGLALYITNGDSGIDKSGYEERKSTGIEVSKRDVNAIIHDIEARRAAGKTETMSYENNWNNTLFEVSHVFEEAYSYGDDYGGDSSAAFSGLRMTELLREDDIAAYMRAINENKIDMANLPDEYKDAYDEADVVYEVVNMGEGITGFSTITEGVCGRPVYAVSAYEEGDDGRLKFIISVAKGFMLYHAEKGNYNIIAQLIQHELDENVLGRTHTEAVLREAYLNKEEGSVISDLIIFTLNDSAQQDYMDYTRYLKMLIDNTDSVIKEFGARQELGIITEDVQEKAVALANAIGDYAADCLNGRAYMPEARLAGDTLALLLPSVASGNDVNYVSIVHNSAYQKIFNEEYKDFPAAIDENKIFQSLALEIEKGGTSRRALLKSIVEEVNKLTDEETIKSANDYIGKWLLGETIAERLDINAPGSYVRRIMSALEEPSVFNELGTISDSKGKKDKFDSILKGLFENGGFDIHRFIRIKFDTSSDCQIIQLLAGPCFGIVNYLNDYFGENDSFVERMLMEAYIILKAIAIDAKTYQWEMSSNNKLLFLPEAPFLPGKKGERAVLINHKESEYGKKIEIEIEDQAEGVYLIYYDEDYDNPGEMRLAEDPNGDSVVISNIQLALSRDELLTKKDYSKKGIGTEIVSWLGKIALAEGKKYIKIETPANDAMEGWLTILERAWGKEKIEWLPYCEDDEGENWKKLDDGFTVDECGVLRVELLTASSDLPVGERVLHQIANSSADELLDLITGTAGAINDIRSDITLTDALKEVMEVYALAVKSAAKERLSEVIAGEITPDFNSDDPNLEYEKSLQNIRNLLNYGVEDLAGNRTYRNACVEAEINRIIAKTLIDALKTTSGAERARIAVLIQMITPENMDDEISDVFEPEIKELFPVKDELTLDTIMAHIAAGGYDLAEDAIAKRIAEAFIVGRTVKDYDEYMAGSEALAIQRNIAALKPVFPQNKFNIIVTGGCGFTGAEVVRKLIRYVEAGAAGSQDTEYSEEEKTFIKDIIAESGYANYNPALSLKEQIQITIIDDLSSGSIERLPLSAINQGERWIRYARIDITKPTELLALGYIYDGVVVNSAAFAGSSEPPSGLRRIWEVNIKGSMNLAFLASLCGGKLATVPDVTGRLESCKAEYGYDDFAAAERECIIRLFEKYNGLKTTALVYDNVAEELGAEEATENYHRVGDNIAVIEVIKTIDAYKFYAGQIEAELDKVSPNEKYWSYMVAGLAGELTKLSNSTKRLNDMFKSWGEEGYDRAVSIVAKLRERLDNNPQALEVLDRSFDRKFHAAAEFVYRRVAKEGDSVKLYENAADLENDPDYIAASAEDKAIIKAYVTIHNRLIDLNSRTAGYEGEKIGSAGLEHGTVRALVNLMLGAAYENAGIGEAPEIDFDYNLPDNAVGYTKYVEERQKTIIFLNPNAERTAAWTFITHEIAHTFGNDETASRKLDIEIAKALKGLAADGGILRTSASRIINTKIKENVLFAADLIEGITANIEKDLLTAAMMQSTQGSNIINKHKLGVFENAPPDMTVAQYAAEIAAAWDIAKASGDIDPVTGLIKTGEAVKLEVEAATFAQAIIEIANEGNPAELTDDEITERLRRINFRVTRAVIRSIRNVTTNNYYRAGDNILQKASNTLLVIVDKVFAYRKALACILEEIIVGDTIDTIEEIRDFITEKLGMRSSQLEDEFSPVDSAEVIKQRLSEKAEALKVTGEYYFSKDAVYDKLIDLAIEKKDKDALMCIVRKLTRSWFWLGYGNFKFASKHLMHIYSYFIDWGVQGEIEKIMDYYKEHEAPEVYNKILFDALLYNKIFYEDGMMEQRDMWDVVILEAPLKISQLTEILLSKEKNYSGIHDIPEYSIQLVKYENMELIVVRKGYALRLSTEIGVAAYSAMARPLFFIKSITPHTGHSHPTFSIAKALNDISASFDDTVCAQEKLYGMSSFIISVVPHTYRNPEILLNIWDGESWVVYSITSDVLQKLKDMGILADDDNDDSIHYGSTHAEEAAVRYPSEYMEQLDEMLDTAVANGELTPADKTTLMDFARNMPIPLPEGRYDDEASYLSLSRLWDAVSNGLSGFASWIWELFKDGHGRVIPENITDALKTLARFMPAAAMAALAILWIVSIYLAEPDSALSYLNSYLMPVVVVSALYFPNSVLLKIIFDQTNSNIVNDFAKMADKVIKNMAMLSALIGFFKNIMTGEETIQCIAQALACLLGGLTAYFLPLDIWLRDQVDAMHDLFHGISNLYQRSRTIFTRIVSKISGFFKDDRGGVVPASLWDAMRSAGRLLVKFLPVMVMTAFVVFAGYRIFPKSYFAFTPSSLLSKLDHGYLNDFLAVVTGWYITSVFFSALSLYKVPPAKREDYIDTVNMLIKGSVFIQSLALILNELIQLYTVTQSTGDIYDVVTYAAATAIFLFLPFGTCFGNFLEGLQELKPVLSGFWSAITNNFSGFASWLWELLKDDRGSMNWFLASTGSTSNIPAHQEAVCQLERGLHLRPSFVIAELCKELEKIGITVHIEVKTGLFSGTCAKSTTDGADIAGLMVRHGNIVVIQAEGDVSISRLEEAAAIVRAVIEDNDFVFGLLPNTSDVYDPEALALKAKEKFETLQKRIEMLAKNIHSNSFWDALKSGVGDFIAYLAELLKDDRGSVIPANFWDAMKKAGEILVKSLPVIVMTGLTVFAGYRIFPRNYFDFTPGGLLSKFDHGYLNDFLTILVGGYVTAVFFSALSLYMVPAAKYEDYIYVVNVLIKGSVFVQSLAYIANELIQMYTTTQFTGDIYDIVTYAAAAAIFLFLPLSAWIKNQYEAMHELKQIVSNLWH